MFPLKHDTLPFVAPPKPAELRREDGSLPEIIIQPFLESWFNEEGLPVFVGDWIETHMQPGECRQGIRWGYKTGKKFLLERPFHSPRQEDPPRGHWARFDLSHGGAMIVTPGEISVHSGTTRSSPAMCVYRRVLQSTEGQMAWPEWQAGMETRIVRPEVHGCPAIQQHALWAIDRLIYQLTGVEKPHHSRPSATYCLIGSMRRYEDRLRNRPTQPALVQVHELLTRLATTEERDPRLPFKYLQGEALYMALVDYTTMMLFDALPPEEKPEDRR